MTQFAASTHSTHLWCFERATNVSRILFDRFHATVRWKAIINELDCQTLPEADNRNTHGEPIAFGRSLDRVIALQLKET